MLLLLRHGHGPSDRQALEELARELGYGLRFLDDRPRVAQLDLHAGTDGRPADRSRFEDLACVESVLDAGEAPELTAAAADRPPTVVEAAGARLGGGHFAVIAGPCAVEDETRLLAIARAVRDAGAALLRGGAYKPRTSPYSFQGLGPEGLVRLARVRAETGLGLVTEVLDPRDVERVAATADVLQIGARSMANVPLLREVGRTRTPVLLKRGLAATVRELLLAAEYVLAEGNPAVVLCERGVRGFDRVTRNLLDLGAVAHLKRATHLPVIVDPSHAAGRPELVPPLAKAGVSAGADGLMVEVHPAPEEARSDAAQALAPEAFARLMRDVERLARFEGKEPSGPRPVRPTSPPSVPAH